MQWRTACEPHCQGRGAADILAGIKPEVARFVDQLKMELELPQVVVVFGDTLEEYFATFTTCMRTTDILWTKPSELSFYPGLGIPIIMAPPIGSQELYNQNWLVEIQAGYPQGDPHYTDQWLFHLLEGGRLADAARDGFLKARKYGTYKIREIIAHGTMERESRCFGGRPLLREPPRTGHEPLPRHRARLRTW